MFKVYTVVENRSKAAFKPINPDFKPKDPSPEPLDEDEPLVVPNKLVGGLQSAAQLAEETANRKKKEDRMKRKALKEMEERRKAAEEAGEEQDETVHRDASGRARDTKREKAEAKRAERDKLQKDMEKMEWGKGLVQREDREKRKRDEEAIAAKPAARWVSFVIPSDLPLIKAMAGCTDMQMTKISTNRKGRICAGMILQLSSLACVVCSLG